MSTYIQRQFSGFLAPGTVTDSSTVSVAAKEWEQQDVYPSTVLKVDTGKYSSTQATVLAWLAETHTVDLPSSYTPGTRMNFTLRTDQPLKITVTSPDHPASETMVYAPSGQYGFYSVVETITSIDIVNVSAYDAVIEYFCFEYPDLDDAGSYRDGYQTLGVIST